MKHFIFEKIVQLFDLRIDKTRKPTKIIKKSTWTEFYPSAEAYMSAYYRQIKNT